MAKNKIIDLNNLTPHQQQNLDNLFAEIKYLTPEQSLAIDDPEQMTQKIFDSIQLRRMEIGPELEDLSTEIFLKYPEFAIKYANRLEKAFCKYICITANGVYKFHYPSEILFDTRVDLPETEYKGGSGDHGFWFLEKDDVVDAICTIRSFLKRGKGEE